jgi:2-polyprenyl-3-methyl-5-hydroxy-6-metoxy-1,4-benzoquinol methylase
MRPALRARLVRSVRLFAAAEDALSPAPVQLAAPFFVRGGYTHRASPRYDDAFETKGVVWQPRVYAAAAAAATALGRRTLVDVGAGNGAKIAALRGRFDLVAIDTGSNFARARAAYPFVVWIDQDLDERPELDVAAVEISEAVIVCADVIEHLQRPDALLRSFCRAVDRGACLVVSTPDRELLWGPRHAGPPPNPAHVREWSRRELAALFASVGFQHGLLTLTQSRTGSPLRNTILAVLARDEGTLAVAAREVMRANTSVA